MLRALWTRLEALVPQDLEGAAFGSCRSGPMASLGGMQEGLVGLPAFGRRNDSQSMAGRSHSESEATGVGTGEAQMVPPSPYHAAAAFTPSWEANVAELGPPGTVGSADHQLPASFLDRNNTPEVDIGGPPNGICTFWQASCDGDIAQAPPTEFVSCEANDANDSQWTCRMT